MKRNTALCGLLFLALGASNLPSQDNHLELGKMWTFENPPLAYLKHEYGFEPDQKWLNSLRLASLRFGRGCSASFVSPKGLIMTNHHCVRGDIAKAQGKEDWIQDSFVATSLEGEVKLKGLTVQQLISMADVTAQMNAGVEDGDDDASVVQKRKANQEAIMAKAREANPELSPQVVSLYHGAQFQLYSYKVYSDIRLVCSPHLQTSHFGGDPDNFTYPRYGIDFTFCRAYEDGKPADTQQHYFRWSKEGPKPNELVFVTGNPGSTGRLLTMAQMHLLRDVSYPMRLDQIDETVRIMSDAAHESPEYAKQNKAQLLRQQNSQKAIRGYLKGLDDDKLMAIKAKAEKDLRAQIDADPELKARFGQVWDRLDAISAKQAAILPKLSQYTPRHSPVLQRGMNILKALDPEVPANQQEQARKAALKDIEPNKVTDKLFVAQMTRAKKWLGDNDPFVKLMLTGVAADQVPTLLQSSELAKTGYVEELLAGGMDAVQASKDLGMQAALYLKSVMRDNGKQYQELGAQEAVQAAKIGQAIFACYGSNVSPDATFTLRLSDGLVKGYAFNGTIAPYRTTFHSMYGRNTAFENKYPFNLPDIWLDKKDEIDLDKGVNFVSTNDIIGGNSGSPIVNKDLEVVGLIFDGNIESLSNRFLHGDPVHRSVSVHVEAIMEALTKIYNAKWVAEELQSAAQTAEKQSEEPAPSTEAKNTEAKELEPTH